MIPKDWNFNKPPISGVSRRDIMIHARGHRVFTERVFSLCIPVRFF